jgi:beta-galactosidase
MSSFPPTDAPDWCNLNVLHRNSLPPRAFFNNFTTAQEALSYDEKRSTTLCLNGQWKFHHCISPFEAPEGFQRPDFDASQWKDLNVPSMWQMEGYSKPHYSNVEYVFPVDPPFGLAAHPPCPVSKLTDRQCRTTTTRLEAISRNSDCPRM